MKKLVVATVLSAVAIGTGAGYVASRPEQPINVGVESEACAVPRIKGNISLKTGEKIYHAPGDRFYAVTQVDADAGERMFCTPDEAEAAGWRRSER